LYTLSALLLALLLDRILGETRRLHPLVGFGLLASELERRLNRRNTGSISLYTERMRGVVAVVLLLLLALLVYYGLGAINEDYAVVEWGLSALVLYFTLGARSLAEHAEAVAVAIDRGDLPEAKVRVSYLVSRETEAMDESACIGATIESVLENGSDSIVAPLLWFALGSILGGGAAAAVGYRIINTLDAMWGYRSERYNHFGWAAAKLDDIVNWLPARLCAICYALMAGSRRTVYQGFSCWSEQAKHWDSPNAGPVMACGAGALDIRLGGAARYRGKWVQRSLLGMAAAPARADIARSLALVNRAVIVSLLPMAGILILAEQMLSLL